jgi:hypothetical protein
MPAQPCLSARFSDVEVIIDSKQPGTYPPHPDIFGAQMFVLRTLAFVERHRREAAKVDFVLERNGRASRYWAQYYEEIRRVLEENLRNQARLMGELITAGKDRVPSQAADCACWHLQRIASRQFTEAEGMRYLRIAQRDGDKFESNEQELDSRLEGVKAANRPSPFPPKKPFNAAQEANSPTCGRRLVG